MTGAPSAQPPRALHVWVGTVVGLGLLAVGSGLAGGLEGRPPWWKLSVAALAFLLGDVPALQIRFGHDHHSFTWSETALVIGLVLLPPSWLLVVAPACVAVAHLLARRAPVKVAFNTAGFAVGVLLAMSTHQWLAASSPEPPSTPRAWLALAAAAVAFFLWNGVSVSMAVALSQGLPLFSVYRKGLGLNALVFLGNTVFGITLVALGGTHAETLLALPVFCGLLFLAYRAYLQAIEDRDTWALLQATSRELLDTTQAGLAPVVVRSAASLFRAELVELILVGEDMGRSALVWRGAAEGEIENALQDIVQGDSTFWPRLLSEREPFEIRYERAAALQQAELDAAGLKQWVVEPLLSHDRCLGALRLGFRGPVRMRPREMQVFGTFVNQVSTSLSNARLFEEMNEERSKLSQIFANSSDGILSVDEHGCISSWNPAMTAITGRIAADAIGRTLQEALAAIAEDNEPVTPCWLRRRFTEGGEVQALASVPSTGPEPRWLSLSASAVSGNDGDSFVVVARDVTAVRHAEQAKQDFVATVSHELRTPLTPLKGFLLTLMRPDFDPSADDRAVFYGRMLDQANRLERLIEDLLSIAQIERGTFSVESGPVLVDEVIDRVAQTSSRPLEVASGGPEAVAHADPGRLEQVLHNLVRNAEKYSPANGRITVSVGSGPSDIEIVVADEGPGIAPEDQEVIFERFRRLGSHLTRASGGAGLGLYIARRLVDAMGGRIWVESQPGTGARFHVALPSESLVLS
jgi:PAS domain S-box-containing protein